MPKPFVTNQSTMLYSEAILLGCCMWPQAHGVLQYTTDGELHLCANGTAIVAAGQELRKIDGGSGRSIIEGLWRWATVGKFDCPYSDLLSLRCSSKSTMALMVAHLNDEHEWDRESIAKFVKFGEAQRGIVASQPKPEHVSIEEKTLEPSIR